MRTNFRLLRHRRETSAVMSARPAELLRALAVLGEPPGPEHAGVAQALGLEEVPDNATYSDVFLFQLYPYASVYVGEEGMMGGAAADRIAGFWSALGRVPPKEPDHLSVLLALYADLIDEDQEAEEAEQALRAEAAGALLHEHMKPWIFGYLDRMEELATGFYARWAALLFQALRSEIVGHDVPVEWPVHLSSAPDFPDPREADGGDFLASLLAPVRSGVILTRADLGRLSQDLDLGLRAGERRYALEHLLGAEAGPVLDWLATEAARQAHGHRSRVPFLGAIGRFHTRRAEATAELCEALARDSQPVTV
jgi:TorA maturation chaperone TorD